MSHRPFLRSAIQVVGDFRIGDFDLFHKYFRALRSALKSKCPKVFMEFHKYRLFMEFRKSFMEFRKYHLIMEFHKSFMELEFHKSFMEFQY